ncbi:MAG TPA: TIGR03118 family protein [Terriglobales bacterium]|nr:TIGR03118 family protein [Terriglobales bacterium]
MRIVRSLLPCLLALLLPLAAAAQHYQQTNLVSDVPGLAAHPDDDLVNAWGLTRGPTTPWWVNDNGSGVSTLYNAAGVKNTAIRVTIPPPPGSTDPSTPTGIAFNGSGSGFVVTANGKSGSARFLFATEDGSISGWNPTVDAANSVITVPNFGAAIYKGLTIATNSNGATLLYAANFSQGRVDVFDSTWQPASTTGGFVDAALPAGYAPFNVQEIGGAIYVSFAKVGDLPDEQHGKGLGFVDKFDTDGNLLMRFEHGPWLDAPWGLAIAPAGFGQFSGDLLSGQFGSGRIAAYDPNSGEFVGFLHGPRGPLVIDGLWALAFGGGNATSGPANTLFFTAGPNDEQHGLFGTLTAIKDDNDGDGHDD